MSRRWWSILVLVALVAGVLWLQGNDATVRPTADRPGVTATDDAAASLPPEAVDTIALIDAGGPFPYRRDGAVFENREGRLPEQARGYWRSTRCRRPARTTAAPGASWRVEPASCSTPTTTTRRSAR